LIGEPSRRRALASQSRHVLDSKPGYREMIAQYADAIREAALTAGPLATLHADNPASPKGGKPRRARRTPALAVTGGGTA